MGANQHALGVDMTAGKTRLLRMKDDTRWSDATMRLLSLKRFFKKYQITSAHCISGVCYLSTLCERLWMGVPAITLKEDRPAAPMGARLLHQLELDSLVAQTREVFFAIAKDLATDHSK